MTSERTLKVFRTKITYQGETIDFTPPFKRLPISEALTTIGKLDSKKVHDKKFLKTSLFDRQDH